MNKLNIYLFCKNKSIIRIKKLVAWCRFVFRAVINETSLNLANLKFIIFEFGTIKMLIALSLRKQSI